MKMFMCLIAGERSLQTDPYTFKTLQGQLEGFLTTEDDGYCEPEQQIVH